MNPCRRHWNQKGIVQIPIIIGMIVAAIALPIATYLVKNNADNRNMAKGDECSTDSDCKAVGNGLVCRGGMCRTFGSGSGGGGTINDGGGYGCSDDNCSKDCRATGRSSGRCNSAGRCQCTGSGSATQSKYSCNSVSGKCEVDYDGPYTDKAQCDNNCQSTGGTSGNCAVCAVGQTQTCSDVAGVSGTKTCEGDGTSGGCGKWGSCQSGNPAAKKYGCNSVNGLCEENASGAYTDFGQCSKNCKVSSCAGSACSPGQTRSCNIGVAGQSGTQTCLKDAGTGSCGYWGECKSLNGNASSGCECVPGQTKRCPSVGITTCISKGVAGNPSCGEWQKCDGGGSCGSGGCGGSPGGAIGGNFGGGNNPGAISNNLSSCFTCPTLTCYFNKVYGLYAWFGKGYATPVTEWVVKTQADCMRAGVMMPTKYGRTFGDGNCDTHVNQLDKDLYFQEKAQAGQTFNPLKPPYRTDVNCDNALTDEVDLKKIMDNFEYNIR